MRLELDRALRAAADLGEGRGQRGDEQLLVGPWTAASRLLQARGLGGTDLLVQDLLVLLQAIEAAAESGGNDATDADFAFHLTVAEATGNHFFPELLRHLGRAIIPRTRIDSPAVAREARADYLRRVNREHHDIQQAIASGDSDAARAAMRTHLSNSRERLRQLRAATEKVV